MGIRNFIKIHDTPVTKNYKIKDVFSNLYTCAIIHVLFCNRFEIREVTQYPTNREEKNIEVSDVKMPRPDPLGSLIVRCRGLL